MPPVLLDRPATSVVVSPLDDLTRRRLLEWLVASPLIIACGTDGADEAPTLTTTATPDTGFPVTLEDVFGSVTLTEAPSRVVSVGRTDHDALLALGIQPLAVWQFVPDLTRGVGPWAEAALSTDTPVLLNISELDLEQIAALAPDLIVNVQSFGDEEQHERLASIAPTISLPPDAAPNSVPWQEVTTRVATAVGRRSEGERLVAETEAALVAAAAAHPEFEGKTISVVLTYGTQIGVYKAPDGRSQILYALGFEPSPYIESLGDGYFQEISLEQIREIEADVVLLLDRGNRSRDETIAAFPLLGDLKAVEEDRLVYVEDFSTSLALSAASVLSIPYALEQLVPPLEAALA